MYKSTNFLANHNQMYDILNTAKLLLDVQKY